ncbi:MAG: hypothetical protein JW783_03115 [Bacteroidales bacterium]|nr:hypothetical protein [Bacteroidales bacterium]MBN2749024.1 hypothetical protein [Bacteroidales bacterium]
MKKILTLIVLAFCINAGFAQEEDYVVRSFETSALVDNQTVTTPYKGMIELQIQHRFGPVENGLTDLFGVYAPSNIRMGLNYGITDKLMVSLGTTKDYKPVDAAIKYAILQQTESGKMPVSLSYYGSVSVGLQGDEMYGPGVEYRFIHRIAYINQFIVARKFSEKLSLQVAPTILYLNSVEYGYKNLNYGISAGGRFNAFGSHSLIFEFDHLLNKQDNKNFDAKPQLALGWEIGTATHAFQVFFANYKGILGQRNFVYNQNDFTKGDYLLGFNVTVRF